jgi:cell shape-determining protein MreC
MDLKNARMGVMALILLLPVACSETKASRCNQIISLSNRTTESIQKLPSENLKPDDRFKKAAEILERSAQEIQNLKLQDPKLTDLQQQLTALYRQDSDHNQKLAAAQDAKIVRTAAAQIQKNSITQKNLVQAVNAYCQAAES